MRKNWIAIIVLLGLIGWGVYDYMTKADVNPITAGSQPWRMILFQSA